MAVTTYSGEKVYSSAGKSVRVKMFLTRDHSETGTVFYTTASVGIAVRADPDSHLMSLQFKLRDSLGNEVTGRLSSLNFLRPVDDWTHYTAITQTWSYTKGESAVNRSITATNLDWTLDAISHTYTVPAVITYPITYDANGGIGAPGSQTKYQGVNIALSSNKPTWDKHDFLGWATTAARGSAGTVDYASGATYSTDAAIALYAAWRLTYYKPTISNVTVERCTSNGTLDDEGTFAKVVFDWTVDTNRYPSNTVKTNGLVITIGTVSKTCTTSGASGTQSVVVGTGSGPFNTDTSYTATISLQDNSGETDSTTTWTGILGLAMFPIDISADGTAIGMLQPAPDDAEGLYIGGDTSIHGNVLIYLDGNASSGTDYDIKTAITSLSWNSSCLIS